MSIDVTAELVINLPREKVAAFVTEPANDPVWVGGIVKAKMLTEPPVQVGTKVARVAKFMGKRMHYTPEVVACEPNALVAMRAESPLAMTIRYEFEDADGGTLTRVCVHGDGTGFFRLAGPLLSRMVRRNINRDLRSLKGHPGVGRLQCLISLAQHTSVGQCVQSHSYVNA